MGRRQAGLAQLVAAPVLQTGGRRFEPDIPYHMKGSPIQILILFWSYIFVFMLGALMGHHFG